MEIILILTAFFVAWLAVIFTAKKSIAYKEFVVNGIKPEIDKLIQNQPQTRKYVQNLNSLQQWKKFSPENYLKSKFTEEWYLVSEIKKDLPIIKKNIADYQSTYSRVYSDFSLKKSDLKWYVSFQIEKDIKKSYQIFSNSNYYNMFEIEWRYTSPQGRNSYQSRNKFTYLQISQMFSKLEESKTSKVEINYQINQKTNSLSNDNLKSPKLDSFNDNIDSSIIDVTGQSTKIKSNEILAKYIPGVPYWPMQYVYAYSEINNTSIKQKEFYRSYKYSFLNGIYYELEGNTNYAFILLFDLLLEYDKHRNISTLESQFNILGKCYPKTKSYADSFLTKRKETENNLELKNTNVYSNDNNYEDCWELGSKYKNKLKLNKAEVKLLNAIYNPSNNFFNIEYCGLEIIKLYIAVISALGNKYIEEETSIAAQFEAVSDIIARKQFRYRKGSQNYKFCVENSPNEFFSHIFKCCENAVRELYNHKRKLNTDNYCSNVEANTEFETKISSKVNDLISILISKVSKPDESTEIELYTQNTNRWKIKFEELTANYNNNLNEFLDSIDSLVLLNEKNPSVENIFFEASKFISKYHKESALTFYICYLYCDLKSDTFNNKQLPKTIQKSLFKTNEQLHDFEKIVSELIKDKNVDKALKSVSKIFKVKRKKIQLNRDSIKEVIEQHSETVELLNEYLKDELGHEKNSIKSQEISNEEIQNKIIPKSEDVHQSAFLSELSFTAIHTTTLELFAKSNFSISQDEFELFTKSKGVFKNQLIESINDTCYEFLDDVLIEEEGDHYTINTNYFQRISAK